MEKIAFIFAAVTAVVGLPRLEAGTFKKAEITQITNQVSVIQPGSGERPAVLNDVVQGDLAVKTGQKSRAELVFADETLTRLGANTIFNFESGTRNLNLQEGTMLLQVPKHSGGTMVRTAPVTAAITGTTIAIQKVSPKSGLFRSKSKGGVKVLVLEGALKLSGKGGNGFINMTSGKMVSSDDDASQFTEPVDFDVEKFLKKSKLLERQCSVRYERIEKVINQQAPLKKSGKLVEVTF